MQDFIQAMTTSMELRGFAKSTQRTYLAHIQSFCKFCGESPATVGYNEVRAFLHHAITVRKLSSAYVNSAYGAIKFYYQSVLCREWNMLHVPRVKKKSSLPTILTTQEVRQIIRATPNLKHKAILSTVYSAGLRVSEAAHLRIPNHFLSMISNDFLHMMGIDHNHHPRYQFGHSLSAVFEYAVFTKLNSAEVNRSSNMRFLRSDD